MTTDIVTAVFLLIFIGFSLWVSKHKTDNTRGVK